VIMVTVATRLNSNRVYIHPARRRTILDWRVSIDVGRFDGVLGGTVRLGARWTLHRGGGDDVVLSRVSIVEEPTVGGGYESLAQAQTRALVRLGEEIAGEIAMRRG
jgi:uncharacterized lipoprotein YmbA